MSIQDLALPKNRWLPLGIVAFIAIVFATGILWATNVLEGKWMVAVLIGLCVPWIALATRDLEYFLLLTFVFFLPLKLDFHLSYEKVGTSIKGLGISACDVALMGLYALWIWKMVTTSPGKRQIQWFPSISIPYAGMILWATLSIFSAADPSFSLDELVDFFKAFLVFLYIANNVRANSQLVGISYMIFAGVILQGLLALAQYFHGTTFGFELLGETRHSFLVQEIGESGLARVAGTQGHPNGFAYYLMLMLPLVTATILAGRSRRFTLAAGIAFFMGFVSLILTFSRMGWVGVALVVPWVIFMGIWKRAGLIKALRGLTIFAFLSALCILPFAGTIGQRLFETDYGRAYSRVPLMEVALNIIRHHPLLGVGLNNYRLVMDQYDNTIERITLHVPNPVHNMFLFVAAEVGIPGLIFFLWWHFALLKRGWRNFWEKEGFSCFLSLGLVGALANNLIHGLVSFGNFGDTPTFAFFVGLLCALSLSHE